MEAMPKTSLMPVSVVIPSLNPNESLLRLIESLELQSFEYGQIIIVDQSPSLQSQLLIAGYSGRLREKIEVLQSTPGLAKSRNAGIGALRDGWEVVLVPDDDVRMDGDISESIRNAVREGSSAGSGRLCPENPNDRIRIDFPSSQVELTPRNVWRSSIEPCYFLTPGFIDKVGLYDESLGLGASSPWQSGEGTDLLLRGLKLGLSVAYVPGYALVEATRPPLSFAGNRRRLRKYARGTGRVFARNYSFIHQVLLIVRSLAKIVLQSTRGRKVFLENLEVLLGRFEGLTGSILWRNDGTRT